MFLYHQEWQWNGTDQVLEALAGYIIEVGALGFIWDM
jgi:hypothetical protein